jgi:aminoglycoside/choline kinase family phosphotransferase
MNPLEADGSSRRFFRVRSGRQTLIVLDHPGGRPGGTGENDACVAIGRHLERRGIPVPSILSYNRGRGWIIQEDLGDLNLQKAISTASSQEEILSLYGSVLDVLLDLQTRGRAGFEDWIANPVTFSRPL